MTMIKTKRPTNRFWVVLGALNVLAILYPIGLALRADSGDAHLFAAVVLIGIVFLLAIADTVSIVAAYLR